MSPRFRALLLAATLWIPAQAMAAPPAPPVDNLPSANPLTRRGVANISGGASEAFRDIATARLALIDDDPDVALRLVQLARLALNAADSDGTRITRAESDFQAEGNPGTAMPGRMMTWVPIGGHYLMPTPTVPSPDDPLPDDGSHVTPDSTPVTMIFKVVLAPLPETQNALNQIIGLLQRHEYYAAQHGLRQVTSWLRFDDVAVQQRPWQSSRENIAVVPPVHMIPLNPQDGAASQEVTSQDTTSQARPRPAPPSNLGGITVEPKPGGGFIIRSFPKTDSGAPMPSQPSPAPRPGPGSGPAPLNPTPPTHPASGPTPPMNVPAPDPGVPHQVQGGIVDPTSNPRPMPPPRIPGAGPMMGPPEGPPHDPLMNPPPGEPRPVGGGLLMGTQGIRPVPPQDTSIVPPSHDAAPPRSVGGGLLMGPSGGASVPPHDPGSAAP